MINRIDININLEQSGERMDRISELEKHIHPGARCHLVGIGGVSMSPLARILLSAGLIVTGSDIRESDTIKELRAAGAKIFIGHCAENLGDAQFIIRTAAARGTNPEIAGARERGIPVFERADAWGVLMRQYENALCISGTHGKTTTTSMCTHILMAANTDPTVMIGGTLPLIHASHRIGNGNTIVMESCEYYNSFLSFSPTIAVILGIEADHLDFFRDLDDVETSFRRFAEIVPEERGIVIANRDDKNTMDTIRGIRRHLVTFGISEQADVRAVNIHMDGRTSTFDILYSGKQFASITLHVPGIHNITNALAAAAATISLGISATAVENGLCSFCGAARRFEYKGRCRGADVYDDYAHHPGELHALLDTVSHLGYKRLLLAFQPHTYSRTKALFDDFIRELKRPDKVFLAEIFAARETNTCNISSADLAKNIPGSVFCSTFSELQDALIAEAQEDDLILTVGAGDIYKIGESIIEK